MDTKDSNLKQVMLYTDGACSGNPGRGGWAAILLYGEHKKTISGYVPSTTNNRMEMFAVVQGLAQLKERCQVFIYSDSAYIVDAFNKGWIQKWQQNNWKTTDKSEVKNLDLWKDLLQRLEKHDYQFVKVKGHADDEYNNQCDKLATKQSKL
ncbi:MAG: ribonuclease HI [Clostridiales bacterium]|jgi:ribonuclease HI|nr:ribonuclease HI [Clostridiales bacterium]